MVPDERLDRLAPLFKPKKVTHAEITLRDLGLAKGSGAGEGISAKKLGDLRTADAILHVVRAFRDPSVPHAEGGVDPVRDLATVDLELTVADHTVAERRLERLEPEIRGARPADRAALERERALLRRCLGALDAERPLRDLELDPDDERAIRGYRFLTLMPQLVVVNLDEADVGAPDAVMRPIRELASRHRATSVVHVCAKLEAEIAELPPQEAAAFRSELGLREPALDRVVRAALAVLGLVSFFTANSDEARAWLVPRGTTAQQAAGAIHSDMERGFIRAEVIAWEELLRAGSEAAARRQGLMRVEARGHEVRDGEVVHVLFSPAAR